MNLPIRRLRHAAGQWLRILGLATIGAFVFHVTLPSVWYWVRPIDLPYSPFFIKASTLLVTFLLFYLVLEPTRVRLGHWRTFLWYPPLWLSSVAACILAAWMDHLPVDLRPRTVPVHWQQLDVILPLSVAFIAAMLLRQVRRQTRPTESRHSITESTRDARSPSTWSWDEIRDWISGDERPITTDRDDLFGCAPVAERIASALQGGRSVALLGTFGAGKSSVLNIARTRLAGHVPTTIVASFDVWAVPRPEDVPRVALDQVVHALDDHVDTLRLRNLPMAYQQLVAALPMRNISRVLGLHTERDSVAELQRLVPVLEVLNARLILIVEDVERTTTEFDTRHLQRLLWALRDIRHVSFVLACDPDNARAIDFSKLCDTIELLRPMEWEHVRAILATAINHWRHVYGDIDPRPDSHHGTPRLQYQHSSRMHEYLRRLAPDTPLDHLVQLLQTPRRLRQVLRRVDRIWQQLHGEADLEDIVILTALRESARPVYEFLIAHIDAAREEPDRMLGSSETLTDDWDQLIASLSNGAVARQLVNLLDIRQLSERGSHVGPPSLQGVHSPHPVDYFRRIIAEQLDREETSDQNVLRDIDAAQRGRAEPLIDGLVAGDDEDSRYPAMWLAFSGRHETTELRELASRVIERLLDRDGRKASGLHAAVLALREACRSRFGRDREAEWLQGEIVRSVRVSLGFAQELWSSWAREDGIVSEGVGRQIRDAMIQAVQETLVDGVDLAAILDPGDPYGVLEMVATTAAGEGVMALEAWGEQLAPALANGARTHPEVILPQVANLLGDEESGRRTADGGPPRFLARYSIDRDRAAAVLGGTLDELLTLVSEYEGSDVYVVRAKDEAGAWLMERQG